MRPSACRSALLLLAGLAACTTHAAPSAGMPTLPARQELDVEAARARNVVAAFLAAEAQGDADADTLLATGADFILTGTRVRARPRLAGLVGPGTASIEEASTGVTGEVAWVVVAYRFEARTPDLSERARATFVLERQRAGWRIRHVHSSMVERW
jgi:hypothetical protein